MCTLSSSWPVFRTVKSRRIRLARQLARKETEMLIKFWLESLKVTPLEKPRLTLKDDIK